MEPRQLFGRQVGPTLRIRQRPVEQPPREVGPTGELCPAREARRHRQLVTGRPKGVEQRPGFAVASQLERDLPEERLMSRHAGRARVDGPGGGVGLDEPVLREQRRSEHHIRVLVMADAQLERPARQTLSPPIVLEVPGLAGPPQVQPRQPGAICRTDRVSGHAPHVERDVGIAARRYVGAGPCQRVCAPRLDGAHPAQDHGSDTKGRDNVLQHGASPSPPFEGGNGA